MWRYRLSIAALALHTLLAIAAIVLVALAIPDNGQQAAWNWMLYFFVDFPISYLYFPIAGYLADTLLPASQNTYLNLLIFPGLFAIILGGAQWTLAAFAVGTLIDALKQRNQPNPNNNTDPADN